MKIISLLSATICLALLASHGQAADHGKPWSLSATESKLSYVSIKKDTVGESNHFKTLSGSMSATGQVTIDIDLSSVETYIDIRNQRMIKYVFGETASKASLTAVIDTDALNDLAVGATTVQDVSGTLLFLGKDIEIDASIVIARLSDRRLLMMTDEMIVVKTSDLGVDAGVSYLMTLAKLPGITRVVPVSVRAVFEKNG